MSLSRISYDIIKSANELQTAVYAYLQFDINDPVGTSKIEEIEKEIAKLVRKLKKEDAP